MHKDRAEARRTVAINRAIYRALNLLQDAAEAGTGLGPADTLYVTDALGTYLTKGRKKKG